MTAVDQLHSELDHPLTTREASHYAFHRSAPMARATEG